MTFIGEKLGEATGSHIPVTRVDTAREMILETVGLFVHLATPLDRAWKSLLAFHIARRGFLSRGCTFCPTFRFTQSLGL
jgi:hypothetical protein